LAAISRAEEVAITKVVSPGTSDRITQAQKFLLITSLTFHRLLFLRWIKRVIETKITRVEEARRSKIM